MLVFFREASDPTSNSFVFSENDTHEGVNVCPATFDTCILKIINPTVISSYYFANIISPSRFLSTTTPPFRTIAAREFVVPKSIPSLNADDVELEAFVILCLIIRISN